MINHKGNASLFIAIPSDIHSVTSIKNRRCELILHKYAIKHGLS